MGVSCQCQLKAVNGSIWLYNFPCVVHPACSLRRAQVCTNLWHRRLIAKGLESEVGWRWMLHRSHLCWSIIPNASPPALPCINWVPSEGWHGLGRQEWRFISPGWPFTMYVLVHTYGPWEGMVENGFVLAEFLKWLTALCGSTCECCATQGGWGRWDGDDGKVMVGLSGQPEHWEGGEGESQWCVEAAIN